LVSNSIVKQKSITFLSRQVKISVTKSKEYRQNRGNVDTLNHVKGKHFSTSSKYDNTYKTDDIFLNWIFNIIDPMFYYYYYELILKTNEKLNENLINMQNTKEK
jgi:hypothetical protein